MGSLRFSSGRTPYQVLFLILVLRGILSRLLGLHYHSLRFRDEAAEIQRGKVIYLSLHSM